MLHILGVIIAVFFWFVVASAQREQRKKLLEWAVPLAVRIAAAQGWVSPHRLINQLNLTKSDAQAVLSEARRQGQLYQAVNGRYYLETSQAHQIVEDGMSDLAAQMQASVAPQITVDASSPYSNSSERSRSNVGMILSLLIATGFLGWFFMTYKGANAPPQQPQSTTESTSPQPAASDGANKSTTQQRINANTAPNAPSERGVKHKNKERRRGDASSVPNVQTR